MVDLPGAYDDDDEFEAPRGVNLKKAVLISASVAGVALLGSAVFYGPVIVRVAQQSDTTITTPGEVGSFTMDDSDGAKEAVDVFRGAVATQVDLDESVGAVYKDQGPSAVRSVFLVAGTGRIWKPADALDAAFKSVTDDSGDVRDVHDVDAGDLGGTMRCGITPTPEGDLPVCGWADNGSVGMAMFPARPVAEAAAAMLQLRNAVEKRA